MNKPQYQEGQFVRFNAGDVSGVGRIRVLSTSGLIDVWIIEVRESNIDPVVYPYSYITMPHTCLSVYEIAEPITLKVLVCCICHYTYKVNVEDAMCPHSLLEKEDIDK